MQNQIQIKLESGINPGDEMTQLHRIVLHQPKEGEWVTHLEMLERGTNKPIGRCWGHYKETFEEGLVDYIERCKKTNVPTNLHEHLKLAG